MNREEKKGEKEEEKEKSTKRKKRSRNGKHNTKTPPQKRAKGSTLKGDLKRAEQQIEFEIVPSSTKINDGVDK